MSALFRSVMLSFSLDCRMEHVINIELPSGFNPDSAFKIKPSVRAWCKSGTAKT